MGRDHGNGEHFEEGRLVSLKYMGVPSACRHGGYEDRCEVCALERQKERLQAKVDYLIEQSRTLLEVIGNPSLTKFFETVVFKGPKRGEENE